MSKNELKWVNDTPHVGVSVFWSLIAERKDVIKMSSRFALSEAEIFDQLVAKC